jgi:hypothetical protein
MSRRSPLISYEESHSRSPCHSLCEFGYTIYCDALYRPKNSVSDAAASVFNVLNNYVAQRAYSRKLEEEADALGLEVCLMNHLMCLGRDVKYSHTKFMANAGYDPRGALDLWEVMALVEYVLMIVASNIEMLMPDS